MKQMTNSEVPAIREAMLGGIAVGTFVRASDGRIFFIDRWGNGKHSGPFPVMEDGTISGKMDDDLHPITSVEIVKKEDLGISEIKRSHQN